MACEVLHVNDNNARHSDYRLVEIVSPLVQFDSRSQATRRESLDRPLNSIVQNLQLRFRSCCQVSSRGYVVTTPFSMTTSPSLFVFGLPNWKSVILSPQLMMNKSAPAPPVSWSVSASPTVSSRLESTASASLVLCDDAHAWLMACNVSRSNVESMSPATRISCPADPTIRSLPVPPIRKSFPAPPVMVSSPAPPKMMSSPLPPVRVSFPLPPYTTTARSTPSAEIVSFPSSP